MRLHFAFKVVKVDKNSLRKNTAWKFQLLSAGLKLLSLVDLVLEAMKGMVLVKTNYITWLIQTNFYSKVC
jgi:hypothetical protein